MISQIFHYFCRGWKKAETYLKREERTEKKCAGMGVGKEKTEKRI